MGFWHVFPCVGRPPRLDSGPRRTFRGGLGSGRPVLIGIFRLTFRSLSVDPCLQDRLRHGLSEIRYLTRDPAVLLRVLTRIESALSGLFAVYRASGDWSAAVLEEFSVVYRDLKRLQSRLAALGAGGDVAAILFPSGPAPASSSPSFFLCLVLISDSSGPSPAGYCCPPRTFPFFFVFLRRCSTPSGFSCFLHSRGALLISRPWFSSCGRCCGGAPSRRSCVFRWGFLAHGACGKASSNFAWPRRSPSPRTSSRFRFRGPWYGTSGGGCVSPSAPQRSYPRGCPRSSPGISRSPCFRLFRS